LIADKTSKGEKMRVKAAFVILVAGLVAIAAGVTASPASAHACSSGFYATHPGMVKQLLNRTPYRTKTTVQQLFRLPTRFVTYRRTTVSEAVRFQPARGADGTMRIFLRAAAAAYLNGLAWPSWPGPSTTNLRTNVHLLLAGGDFNRIRAYRVELSGENNRRPCVFKTAETG
jgi:hypothetical protein